MFALKKPYHSHAAHGRLLKGTPKRFVAGKFVTIKEMDERIEDAELNAIADERASGPFVRVSLDDL